MNEWQQSITKQVHNMRCSALTYLWWCGLRSVKRGLIAFSTVCVLTCDFSNQCSSGNQSNMFIVILGCVHGFWLIPWGYCACQQCIIDNGYNCLCTQKDHLGQGSLTYVDLIIFMPEDQQVGSVTLVTYSTRHCYMRDISGYL